MKEKKKKKNRDDEEEEKRLKAALDPSFFIAPTFNKLNAEPKKEVTEKSNDQGWKPYRLSVSNDAQAFIAKKLSEHLNKSIKDVKPKRVDAVTKPTESDNEGIFLFRSSKHRIRSDDDQSEVNKKAKLRKMKAQDSDSDEENIKLNSVAVSSEAILNGCVL